MRPSSRGEVQFASVSLSAMHHATARNTMASETTIRGGVRRDLIRPSCSTPLWYVFARKLDKTIEEQLEMDDGRLYILAVAMLERILFVFLCAAVVIEVASHLEHITGHITGPPATI